MKRLLLLLLCALCTSQAFAGPLLDRLRERREASQDDALEQDDDTGSRLALPAGAKVLHDVAYGSDAKQSMDVYLPANPANAPVIFMVHGGAWRTGDKAMSRVVNNKVARWLPRGIIFISVNYRLLPKADPLQQAEDVGRALATAQGKAREWGANPDAFVLMGHSAGAHLVSLINSPPERTLALGARPWLGTVSLDTAAMDIVTVMQNRHFRFYDKAFGSDPAFWQATSPMQQLNRQAPPLFAVCSSTRPDHPCDGTQTFADKAHDMGLRVEMLPQALKHSQINENLGQPGAYTTAVERFMAGLSPALRTRLGEP
ncbi:alpha/beta hydrolase [Uliginosibacterium gangwonense]|uniref:alpha/beta hydrolase n=1 Tax=Uliginosibacterium gangwonense TaxID=392736 RepID=UPI00037BE207|nr:alpha/beta hydrolase [Uliginosibacterium gangwonense]